MVNMFLPESVIGIIGGGQLGKMLSNAAQTLGYRVVIWSEEDDCPACRVATSTIIGKYTDPEALQQFINQVDVATVETEHIPLATLEGVEKKIPLYPEANIVRIAQNRKIEKNWLSDHHFPVVPYQVVHSIEDIKEFMSHIDHDVVVKTITGGYDGKGQLRITDQYLSENDIKVIKSWLDQKEILIAEEWVPIHAEVSVIAARNMMKTFQSFPMVENEHREHILHRTIAPARLEENITAEAIEITKNVMEQMDYVGLLCVEFFYSKDGQLYINELAPRPHNSGHYSIDAAVTSQFEQTIRSITGLPLGDTSSLSPSVMTNLLGDLWQDGFAVNNILSEPFAKLHLYGKKEARGKRKMGHYTTIADSIDKAVNLAESIYLSL